MYVWFIYFQIKRCNVMKNIYNCTKFTINHNETNQIIDQAYYVVALLQSRNVKLNIGHNVDQSCLKAGKIFEICQPKIQYKTINIKPWCAISLQNILPVHINKKYISWIYIFPMFLWVGKYFVLFYEGAASLIFNNLECMLEANLIFLANIPNP